MDKMKMDLFSRFTGLKERMCPAGLGLRSAVLHIGTKLSALCTAVCACFRRPGLSEAAAVTAFCISAIGSIAALFQKRVRKLMPLFGVLAALGAAVIVLRCLFPRDRD